MARGTRILLGSLLLWHSWPAAGEVSNVEVQRLNPGYQVLIDMRTSVPPEQAVALLSDLPGLSRLNEAVLQVQVLRPSARGNARVRTATRLCVAFFCITTHQVNEVIPLGTRRVRWLVEPEHSDFEQGVADLRVTPMGRGSRVLLMMRLVPKFWVPPLIDTWLIKRKMREEGIETLAALEQLAAGRRP